MTTFIRFALASPLPEQAVIVAQHEYLLKAVTCDQPLLVIPLQGCKRLRQGDTWLDCVPGQFLMLHHAQQIDVINQPALGAPYRALAIGFPWHLLEIARSLLSRQPLPSISRDGISLAPVAPLEPALHSYLACDPGDVVAVDHAALGLLLALARAGHSAYLQARDPSLAARARMLIAAAPARQWKSADLEAAFCISSATLRRRLQEEGSSFRTLLQEARLHHGLLLLQTSRRSLKAVAAACGYGSPDSFSRAFSQRFGQEPAAIAQQRD
ncbi:MAG: helix-turn-helix transcriptional regulator [Pseudomonas sp.]